MILDHPRTKPQAGFLPRQRPQYALLTLLLGIGLPLTILASLHTSHAPQATQAHPGGMLVPRIDSVPVTAPLPADVFMQALIAQNGQLAWQQLCPATQVAVSPGRLSTIAVSLWPNPAPPARLGVDFVGSHAWGDGGQVRVYVVMASWPSGATAGRLHILTTQADGCVASF